MWSNSYHLLPIVSPGLFAAPRPFGLRRTLSQLPVPAVGPPSGLLTNSPLKLPPRPLRPHVFRDDVLKQAVQVAETRVPGDPPGVPSKSSDSLPAPCGLVGGRLRFFRDQWVRLGTPDTVLRIISECAILFTEVPQFSTPPSLDMDATILNLLESGLIKPTQTARGFLSRLFLVPKPDGSLRPIFNLMRLNDYLATRKFRLINRYRVPAFLQRNDFLAKLDLSQAYYHVCVKSLHRRFLCLAYRGTIYEMTCLPFGLTSAPKPLRR